MSENTLPEIPKVIINDKSVVYNSWEDFWNDVCKDKFGINVPVRFFWSGDTDLEVEIMSTHVAMLDKRIIVECIINNVSKEKFDHYTRQYKDFFINNYETEVVKTLEDY